MAATRKISLAFPYELCAAGVGFSSDPLAVAPGALEKLENSGLLVEPVWIRGEYACDIDRPSYFLVGERFLVRCAPDEGDGDDWYGCKDGTGEGY